MCLTIIMMVCKRSLAWSVVVFDRDLELEEEQAQYYQGCHVT